MIEFRHKGCRSALIRYIGTAPLYPSPKFLLAREWELSNGEPILPGTYTRAKCPDCGLVVKVHAGYLEPLPGQQFSCTTEQFWELMCHPGTVRLSRNELHLKGVTYTCETPPDDVPGFIQSRIVETMRLLGKPAWWERVRDWWRGYSDEDIVMGRAPRRR